MARKFIDLDEAAKMLGIAPDTLNEMRERQKIYGYRDGGSWKFKPEDVEKIVAERDAAEQEGEFAELDEDPDSILLSEVELGGSDDSTSSTIIGGRSNPKDSEDSDIQLAAEPSDIQIAPEKHDSDIGLGMETAIGGEAKSGSDVLEQGSGVSPMFDDLDTMDLEMESAASSGISSKVMSDSSLKLDAPSGGSDIMLGSDALKLEGSNLAFGDDLSLGEAAAHELTDSKAGGSDVDLVGGDEDGDLVLGGSSHGGDLSRAGDSGISLLDPTDSGLSLESAPLELGGSAVESLELGEDDNMILSDEPAAKSGLAGKSAAAGESHIPGLSDIGAKSGVGQESHSDDDFLLTPLEEAGGEESDSGSQVIALDTDVEFEEAGASAVGAGGLLEEDLGEGLGAVAGFGAGALTPAATQMTAAAPAAGGAVAAPEAPFSGWNVGSLVLCALMLMFIGMFMYDLLRNMWSWNGTYAVNSTMMDAVLSWFEK